MKENDDNIGKSIRLIVRSSAIIALFFYILYLVYSDLYIYFLS